MWFRETHKEVCFLSSSILYDAYYLINNTSSHEANGFFSFYYTHTEFATLQNV